MKRTFQSKILLRPCSDLVQFCHILKHDIIVKTIPVMVMFKAICPSLTSIQSMYFLIQASFQSVFF